LYGGVGLGKHIYSTPLETLAAQSQVLYVSSEEFTNDLINAILHSYTQAFAKYAELILVMMISNSLLEESTQEEFSIL
jgi:chromosomal replication initiator protein